MGSTYEKYGTITGALVMTGFGSVASGVFPLLFRHLNFDVSRMVVVDPSGENEKILLEHNPPVKRLNVALTRDNYREILTPLLNNKKEGEQSFLINLTVDTSSVALIGLCRDLNCLYIDTVVEPWPGVYDDPNLPLADRTNYALRETLLAEKRAHPQGPTAVSCCGANPGMVSWLTKRALLILAKDLGIDYSPTSETDPKKGWAELMSRCGVKGIHIAERDTSIAKTPKRPNGFFNTWSSYGFISESMQPSELGWGTHEKWEPSNLRSQTSGSKCARFLEQPGGFTKVRSWCPTLGPQVAFLVTHNESISISDYFTVVDKNGDVVYRPTVHYAYRPCNDAVVSLLEMQGNAYKHPTDLHVWHESELLSGFDELGVLLYGHGKNAFWYGSFLTLEDTRKLVPYQSATGLQITSAVLAGVVWALENPNRGIVDCDEIDHARCLQVAEPYLGRVSGTYTEWNPLSGREDGSLEGSLFPSNVDRTDPWQFKNVLIQNF